jgi:hypothetical protein
VILIYAIIFLILLALILRRDLAALGQIQYRGGWKLGVGIASLFILQAVLVIYVPGQTTFQMIVVMASQLALILLFVLNRHVPGAKLFALGVILNTTVMIANGGWMPVTPETYQAIRPNRVVELQSRAPNSKGIMLPRSETNLWILSDIIKISLPGHKNALSIGDVLLILGIAQFLLLGAPKIGQSQTTAIVR